MFKDLHKDFERLAGQPVKVFTDDSRIHRGYVMEQGVDCVRILDRCHRVNLIEFCHIDAVEEPQMRLHRCYDRRDEPGDAFDDCEGCEGCDDCYDCND